MELILYLVERIICQAARLLSRRLGFSSRPVCMIFAVGKVAVKIFPSTLYPRSIIPPVQTPYLNCNITLIRATFGQN